MDEKEAATEINDEVRLVVGRREKGFFGFFFTELEEGTEIVRTWSLQLPSSFNTEPAIQYRTDCTVLVHSVFCVYFISSSFNNKFLLLDLFCCYRLEMNNRYRNVPGLSSSSKATASTLCQKCLKRDMFDPSKRLKILRADGLLRHYSFECTVSAQERPYISRPSRTQQLQNPKLIPKLSSDTPNNLLQS